MNYLSRLTASVIALLLLFSTSQVFAVYNLEVPAEPWDEYRLQFKNYTKHLQASYDLAFLDDYEGAVREVNKAIELLPDEGSGFAERSKYHRILQNKKLANQDLQQAITLFGLAIERYRPHKDKKSKKNRTRKMDLAKADQLVATLQFQRAEAYFSDEQYKKATDDFISACQGGNALACTRILDVKAIIKLGSEWVPISSRQYYNRRAIEEPTEGIIRVRVLRDDEQRTEDGNSSESYVEQLFEINCVTREFHLVEAQVTSNGKKSAVENFVTPSFMKPIIGTTPGKLITAICPRKKRE